MKKLLATIVLCLLFNNIGFADILTFKNCYSFQNDRGKTGNKNFDSDFFEKNEYTINFNLGTVLLLRILTDKEHTKQKSDWIKSENAKKFGGSGSQKQTMSKTVISHYDNERVYASSNNNGTNIELSINLVNGEVFTEIEFEGDSQKFWVIHKCVPPDISGVDKGKEITGASGTAFFISSKGNLLTNNHVVEGCKLSKISYKNKDYDAKLIATDKTLDLALLKADIIPKKFISFSNNETKKLNTIYVAGYPLGKGLSDDLKISSGIVSSLKGFQDNSNEIQIDAPINPGNSGGPIVNENGDLVAIAVSGLAKDQTEGINFGIKSSAAELFLISNNVNPKKSMYAGIKDKDQLLEILEEGTVYTYCNK